MGNTQGSFQPLDMLLQTWNGGAGECSFAHIPAISSIPHPASLEQASFPTAYVAEDWANGRVSV